MYGELGCMVGSSFFLWYLLFCNPGNFVLLFLLFRNVLTTCFAQRPPDLTGVRCLGVTEMIRCRKYFLCLTFHYIHILTLTQRINTSSLYVTAVRFVTCERFFRNSKQRRVGRAGDICCVSEIPSDTALHISNQQPQPGIFSAASSWLIHCGQSNEALDVLAPFSVCRCKQQSTPRGTISRIG